VHSASASAVDELSNVTGAWGAFFRFDASVDGDPGDPGGMIDEEDEAVEVEEATPPPSNAECLVAMILFVGVLTSLAFGVLDSGVALFLKVESCVD